MKVLVIAPHYNYFIKSQIDTLARFVDEIHVFVKHNPLVEIFSKIPFWTYADHLKNYTLEALVDMKDKLSNVYLHVVHTMYFIPDGKNTRIGKTIAAHFVYHYGYAGFPFKNRNWMNNIR